MNREKEVNSANNAVHSCIGGLLADKHDPQDIANVMLAYALNLMVDVHGRRDVARHLYMLSLKFADPDQNPLDGAPSKH